jgi:hypothetical protein
MGMITDDEGNAISLDAKLTGIFIWLVFYSIPSNQWHEAPFQSVFWIF